MVLPRQPLSAAPLQAGVFVPPSEYPGGIGMALEGSRGQQPSGERRQLTAYEQRHGLGAVASMSLEEIWREWHSEGFTLLLLCEGQALRQGHSDLRFKSRFVHCIYYEANQSRAKYPNRSLGDICSEVLVKHTLAVETLRLKADHDESSFSVGYISNHFSHVPALNRQERCTVEGCSCLKSDYWS